MPSGQQTYDQPNLYGREPTVEDFARLHQGIMDAGRRSAGLPPLYGDPDDPTSGQGTPGEVFVRSAGYRDWLHRFPAGAPAGPGNHHADPVAIQGGMRALVTSADLSAGSLVPTKRMGLLETGLVRPLTLRELLSVVPVDTDLVEYAKESSRVNAAAPVAEASALTGVSGTKPEGGLTFEVVNVPVRTFAVWIPVTRRILSDATQLQTHINEYLVHDLGLEVEDQVMGGTGTGEDFLGILNTPGTQTEGPPGAGESFIYSIRRAIGKVTIWGRTKPNAILMHPNDGQTLDLMTIANEVNRFLSDPFTPGPRTLFGFPVVESEAVPAGTAVVGDFRRAVVFDREQASITVGTVGDDFIRNVVRVLGEARAAFGVLRPKAFCITDLAA